jgi:hypothetical protein
MAAPPLTPEQVKYIKAAYANQQIAQQGAAVNGVPLDAAGLIAQLPPDVQAVFAKAVQSAQGGTPLDPAAIQGDLMQTNWFRTQSDSEKNLVWATITNPAEVQQEMNNQALKVLQMASQMGVHISLATAASLTHSFIAQGWDDQKLQLELSQQQNARGYAYSPGTILTAEDQVHQTAQNYGINISNATAQQWGQQIAGGQKDQAAFEDYAKYQGMLNHPYWATQIENGATVKQLSDPWIQQAAQTLEVSPDSINLTDPKWNFTTKDAKGNTTPMPVAAWNEHLMTDPRYGWDQTQNAKTAAYQMTDQLQQAFGAK